LKRDAGENPSKSPHSLVSVLSIGLRQKRRAKRGSRGRLLSFRRGHRRPVCPEVCPWLLVAGRYPRRRKLAFLTSGWRGDAPLGVCWTLGGTPCKARPL